MRDATQYEYDRANPIQRASRRLIASGPGSWLAIRLLHHLDRPVYRLTRGRHTLSGIVGGLPLVMLTTTGARSGQRRTTPVLALPTEEGLVVIASNYGQARHPAWYHNLRSDPAGEVAVDGTKRRFRAVEAEGERRERIWKDGLRMYPGWGQYEKRATNRRIPVLVLEEAMGAEEG